ncbi:MAG: DegV family protein [Thermoflexales bacterium]|nr:DegV family protein [Thermoflexales bacterium]
MKQRSDRRIAVVTDSTADIPPALIDAYGIHVVPVYLVMGDKTWRDGVDISPAAFYQLLQSSTGFPHTAPPDMVSFQDLFIELSKTAEGIVAVLLSDELSATLGSARAARASLPDVPIEVVDSRATSMMLGFSVLAAARAAASGSDLAAVAGAAREVASKARIYFVVDTLEYLHRGGRIGAAAKLIGSALDIKPVLEVADGMVAPVARVRTRPKAMERLYKLLEEKIPGRDRLHMAVVNVAAQAEAARLKELLEARFHPVEMIETECSPTLGAHAGPGAVGVVFYAE